MKLALVTLDIPVPNKLGRFPISSIFMKHYADKVGADFIRLDSMIINGPTPHFEKFQMHQLLDIYDRILYIDVDAIISEDCPNLFELVDPELFGAVYSNKENEYYSDHRIKDIIKCQDDWGNIDWRYGYINSGVMIFSKKHKYIFEPPTKAILDKEPMLWDQSLINYRLAKHRTPFHLLPKTFNHHNFIYAKQFKQAYIKHYAGGYRAYLIVQHLIHIDLTITDPDLNQQFKSVTKLYNFK